MTEEEIAALQAKAAKADEAEAARLKAEQEKQNITNELIEQRRKKQEALEELEREKNSKKENTPGTESAEDVVEKILQLKEKEAVKKYSDEALAEIKKTYREFSPEHDEAGIVFSKFEAELKKFDFSSLKTKDEIVGRMKEVYDFMNRGKTQQQESKSYHQGTPSGGGEPATVDKDQLTDLENKLLESTGMSKDKFLAMKAKYPAYINKLLNS